MFQQMTLVGNVGKVEDLRFTPNGDAVFNFSIAASKGKGDKKKTTWYRVTVWNKYAEVMANVIKVGHKLTVVGELDVVVDEKNGKTYVNLNVTANFIADHSSTPNETPAESANNRTDDIDPNQIPF